MVLHGGPRFRDRALVALPREDTQGCPYSPEPQTTTQPKTKTKDEDRVEVIGGPGGAETPRAPPRISEGGTPYGPAGLRGKLSMLYHPYNPFVPITP